MKPWLLLLALVASGCQCARAAKCSAASGHREQCEAMADDCMTLVEDRCVGTPCPSLCTADESQQACLLPADWHARCPADARIFANGSVLDLHPYAWKLARLSDAGVAVANKRLTQEDVASLTLQDRQELCGAYPSEPCDLKWDDAQQVAVCTVPADACAHCQFVGKPVVCQAKNKCSGVICL
jgi:hypothetical protein